MIVIFLFTIIAMSCSKKNIPNNFIPISYDGDGYLYLNVLLDEKYKGNFIFDTGFNQTVLDSLFCSKINYKSITTDIKIGGIGNSTKVLKLYTDSIHFKFINTGYHFKNRFSIILDLKKMVGKNIDGILGLDTFSNVPYSIDYVTKKISFINSVKGYEPLKAKFKDNQIFIELAITINNGNKLNGMFLVDTGSNQTIFNNHVFINDGIYNNFKKKKFYAKGGIGGDSNGYFLPVEEINIGRYNIKNIIATVSSDTLGMLANKDYMGIIGNDVLDDFHIIFDHQKEKIWIKSNKNFNKNTRKLFRGISFLDNGEKWVVAGIVEDAEAFKNGVRMNDQILEINNIPVEQIDLDKFMDKLNANDVLKLKLKRDDEEWEVKFKLNVFLKS